jgi:hypothetical protein
MTTLIKSSNITPGTITAADIEASGVTAASYGSASQVPVITVNAQGLITAASTTSVAGVSSFSWDSLTETLNISTADGGSFNADISGMASESYVDTAINNLIDSAPGTLDTLGEIATALQNNDTDIATILSTQATKVDKINITGATVGSASAVPVITFNAQGQITSATTTAVAGVSSTSFSGGVLTINTSDGSSYTTDFDTRYFTETEANANFLGINAKATDSDTLDGLNSTQFLRSDADDTTTGRLSATGGITSNAAGAGVGSAGLEVGVGQNNTAALILGQNNVINWRIRNQATTGTLEFSGATSGDVKMAIDTSGNVGIGTTSPTQALNVHANDSRIEISTDASGTTKTQLQFTTDRDGTPGYGFMGLLHNNGDRLLRIGTNGNSGTDYGIQLDANNNVDIRNNLGVGTDSPSTKLHLAGDASPTITFTSSSGPRSYIESNTVGSVGIAADESNTGTSSNINFRVDGTERMRIYDSGDVAIKSANGTNNFYWDASDSYNNGQLKLGTGSGVSGEAMLAVSRNYGDITNPLVHFDITGNDGRVLRVSSDTSRTDMQIFDVINNNGTAFAVRGDGNVGIGTGNPTYKLQVDGDIRGTHVSSSTASFDQIEMHGHTHLSTGTIYSGNSGSWKLIARYKEGTSWSFAGGIEIEAIKEYMNPRYNRAIYVIDRDDFYLNRVYGDTSPLVLKVVNGTTYNSVTNVTEIWVQGVAYTYWEVNFKAPYTTIGIDTESTSPSQIEVYRSNTIPSTLSSEPSSTVEPSFRGPIFDNTGLMKSNFLYAGEYEANMNGSSQVPFNFKVTESSSAIVTLSTRMGCTGFSSTHVISGHYATSETAINTLQNNARYGSVSYSLSQSNSGQPLYLNIDTSSLGWGCSGSKPSTETVYFTIMRSASGNIL